MDRDPWSRGGVTRGKRYVRRNPTLVGRRGVGGLALIAIWIGTVSVNAMNDYSGSLALQAAGARIKRPYIAVIVTAAAFFLTCG